MLADLAAALRDEATAVSERRLLVLAGDRDAGVAAAANALDAAGVPREETTLVADRGGLDCERVPVADADRLLGTTRTAVVLDCHDETRPNALGRVVGAVDGGGLLVLLVPPLDKWSERRDGFDAGLAVPPFDRDDVTGRFRRRLVRTLRAHPGVAIVDVDEGTVERDGLTTPAPRTPSGPVLAPDGHTFPAAAYDHCRTQNQADAVAAFERLRDPGTALVVEADRGRGKSAAAGLAVACLAQEASDVLVTAPEYRSAEEVFVRAVALLRDLDTDADSAVHVADDSPRRIDAGDGCLRFARPPEAAALPGDPDLVVVDEAAALPVRLLGSFLDADRAAFVTTVHGYEGAGRGFDVRFRDRLADSGLDVTEVRLDDPIRYAPGDPVEVWAFRALLLDARPAVDPLVADAEPATTTYRALDRADLAEDAHLLREAFGLLVYAHYRTEPDDLARLLDGPNLSVRALCHDGHVASVALLAREGGLDADTRRYMYEGGRVRGNMLPDVLTSQLRDEDAAVPVGYRVMRIATHPAVRSRGLGSRFLAEIEAEFGETADWLGTGYGATPELLSFWGDAGYSTVHLSTTRNDASGEYSAVMVRPTADAGHALHDRHASWFAERIAGVLADALRDADPDVVRAALRATDADPGLSLSADDWRVVAGAAYGPGLYSVDPDPFRRLAAAYLVVGDPDLLFAREERLLVLKVLQARPWGEVADRLGYHSQGQAMRALGDAYQPLVDAWGDDAALAEKRRYE
jgi:tRNA(Met) cytidine acetyltransferase